MAFKDFIYGYKIADGKQPITQNTRAQSTRGNCERDRQRVDSEIA